MARKPDPLRVVIWGPGGLVGMQAFTPRKHGVDAGDLPRMEARR